MQSSAVGSAAYTINGAVATPTFSPAAGTYSGTQTVTISSATSGATIYYTTNGTDPTTSSTLYTGPISVASTQTVKAIAVKASFTDSAIGSAAYTIGGAVTLTWEALERATDTDGYLTKSGGTTTPAGGRAVQTIDATQPFTIIMENDGTNQQSAMLYLDDDNTANYNYADSGNAYLLGVFEYAGVLYRSTQGNGATSILSSISKPFRVRMKKSGNDIVVATSVDGGTTWTDRYTATGALVGKTTLWVKGMLGASPPNANSRMRVTKE